MTVSTPRERTPGYYLAWRLDDVLVFRERFETADEAKLAARSYVGDDILDYAGIWHFTVSSAPEVTEL